MNLLKFFIGLVALLFFLFLKVFIGETFLYIEIFLFFVFLIIYLYNIKNKPKTSATYGLLTLVITILIIPQILQWGSLSLLMNKADYKVYTNCYSKTAEEFNKYNSIQGREEKLRIIILEKCGSLSDSTKKLADFQTSMMRFNNNLTNIITFPFMFF